MKRRELIVRFAGAAAVSGWAKPGLAASEKRSAHIGFISGGDPTGAQNFISAFRDGLAESGFIEPRTLTIDPLYADYALDRIPAMLEELERRHVDIIVTHAAATLAVVKGRRSLPVVYEFSADPVTSGIAESLARPLFNATGITLMRSELNAKRLELLHEILPGIRRVAVVFNPLHPGHQLERNEIDADARSFGMDISYFPTPNLAELHQALEVIASDPPQALLALSDGFVIENRKVIIETSMRLHIPVVSGWAVMARSGALFSYGPRLTESYRRVAYFVQRILAGAKPADLPIEQPTILELVVNQSSATALGIPITTMLLARADEIVD